MPDEVTSKKTSPQPKRRWFRYSLRTLLLATTVLCVWLGFKVNAARRQKEAVVAVRKLGAVVKYDYEPGPDIFETYIPRPDHGWLAKLLGVDFVHDIVGIYVPMQTQKDCTLLPYLLRFPRLRFVGLCNRSLHDNDLQYLVGLQELQVLWLYDSSITDHDIDAISTLPNLVQIYLSSTSITDACVDSLAKLPSLRIVDTRYTFITLDGVRRLNQMRPKLEILHSLNEDTHGDLLSGQVK